MIGKVALITDCVYGFMYGCRLVLESCPACTFCGVCAMVLR